MEQPTLGHLVERVDRLERENRRLKVVGTVAAALLATVITMGQASRAKVVEAESFVVRDQTGAARVVMGTGSGGAGEISVIDGSGKARVAIDGGGSSSGFTITDGLWPRVMLWVTDDGRAGSQVIGSDGNELWGVSELR